MAAVTVYVGLDELFRWLHRRRRWQHVRVVLAETRLRLRQYVPFILILQI